MVRREFEHVLQLIRGPYVIPELAGLKQKGALHSGRARRHKAGLCLDRWSELVAVDNHTAFVAVVAHSASDHLDRHPNLR